MGCDGCVHHPLCTKSALLFCMFYARLLLLVLLLWMGIYCIYPVAEVIGMALCDSSLLVICVCMFYFMF